jgi:NAD(P)-dependent dehydrogenase (short-subunit alcohol dehydrogenase family)
MASTVVVTGSRGLIGRALVPLFQKQYQVHELDLSLGHDLSDETFVKQWFAQNPADYLVNLFALNDSAVATTSTEKQTLFNIPLDSFRKYCEVNLTALFSVCREFARNNKKGSIVNFSSTYGIVSPRPELYDNKEKHIGYSVTKAGVVQMTRHLAVHLGPDIRVNCVVPGGVTDTSHQPTKFHELYSKHTPMRRMMHAPELFGILEYLCSDKSSYSTGGVFPVDGGWTAL